MDASPFHQSDEERFVGGGELGHEIGPQPVGQVRGLSRPERLDHDRGEALHRHAAQQLAGRRRAGVTVDHLDRHAEWAHQRGVVLRPRSRGERRRAKAAAGNRGHQRNVDERLASRRRDRGPVRLRGRRARRQVGVDRARRQYVHGGVEHHGRLRRSGQGENDLGCVDRAGRFGPALDPLRGRDRPGIERRDLHTGGDEVGGEPPAGLSQTEHCHAHGHPSSESTYLTPSSASFSRSP